MTFLFSLLVVAIAIAAIVYAITASSRKKANAPVAPARRTLANLQVGDIVRYRMLPENNFSVTGFIDYQESDSTWREVRLVDGKTVRWLCIEEEDFEVELTLWKEIDLGFSVAGQVPGEIQFSGRTYRQKESGNARAKLSGQTGNRQKTGCRYWDYQEPQGQLLSIEQWGGEFEVSLGERVRQDELDIFTP